MDERYKFSIDPSLEHLKLLPGGQAIYDYARNKAEQLAAAIDVGVTDLIQKYELPTTPATLTEMGYQIIIEIKKIGSGQEERSVVLYKKVDEVKIIV